MYYPLYLYPVSIPPLLSMLLLYSFRGPRKTQFRAGISSIDYSNLKYIYFITDDTGVHTLNNIPSHMDRLLWIPWKLQSKSIRPSCRPHGHAELSSLGFCGLRKYVLLIARVTTMAPCQGQKIGVPKDMNFSNDEQFNHSQATPRSKNSSPLSVVSKNSASSPWSSSGFCGVVKTRL
jgi:hypothetical protein